jgi:membrane protein implicated in regulation of membrane protease activity
MIYKLVGIRGPLALFLKLGLLGGADAFLIWLTAAALNKSSFIIAGVVIATIIFLNYFLVRQAMENMPELFRIK